MHICNKREPKQEVLSDVTESNRPQDDKTTLEPNAFVIGILRLLVIKRVRSSCKTTRKVTVVDLNRQQYNRLFVKLIDHPVLD